MASGSKTTAVHFTLIFFVMLSVILGVVSYMYYDKDKELRAKFAAAKDAEEKSKKASIKATNELNIVKQRIGYTQAEIGEGPNPDQTSVRGAIDSDEKNYGANFKGKTLSEVIKQLNTSLNTTTKDRDVKMVAMQSLTNQMANLRNQYDIQVKTEISAKNKAEEDRAAAVKDKQEVIAAKDNEINTLQSNFNKVTLEMEQLRDQHIIVVNKLNQRIALLIAINIKLNERLEAINVVSVSRPDGVIRWIDNTQGTVWINLGKADNLPVRTSFSVYSKSNSGVTRSSADIKGSIEVTRILEPHLAECKIIGDNIHKPFALGDPIHTPIWSVGVKERFSLVGWIDLDGDGKHELDRKQLHSIISAAGAEIGGEVDDEGNFSGTDIDEKTKYLVVGEIPSQADFTDIEDQEKVQLIQEQLKKMKEQAREQGVRVMTLKDFVVYMGYKPSRRLWLPGEKIPWLLKSGSHSAGVNETIGNRESTGQTAGTYSRSKRLKQPKSSGQTSKLFK